MTRINVPAYPDCTPREMAKLGNEAPHNFRQYMRWCRRFFGTHVEGDAGHDE